MSIHLERPLLVLFMVLVAGDFIYAQHSVYVNEFTGSANASIPIWNLVSKDINHSISLDYYTRGLRVNTQSSEVGLGWQLNAGGYVTREVRGLPDELKSGDGKHVGWLRDNTHQIVGNFSPSYTGTIDNCASQELVDYNFLKGLGGFDDVSTIYDTEPDIFNVSVQGLSLKFVFDNAGNISTIPYRDIDIDPTFNSITNKLESFVVTDERGVKYFFSDAVLNSYNAQTAVNPPVYKKSAYYSILDGYTCAALWHLVKIASVNDGEIVFKYQNNRQSEDVDAFGNLELVVSWDASRDDSTTLYLYDETLGYQSHNEYLYQAFNLRPKDLSEIITTDYKIKLTDGLYKIPVISDGSPVQFGNRPLVLKRPLLNWIDVYAIKHNSETLVKKYVFDFDIIQNTEDNNYSHIFLTQMRETIGNFSKPPYFFEYYNVFPGSSGEGVSADGVSIPIVEGGDFGFLPKRNSNRTDYFGYYNPTIGPGDPEIFEQYVYPGFDGFNRYRKDPIANFFGGYYLLSGKKGDVDERFVQSGALKTFATPMGAKTFLFYEPNRYHDPLAGGEVYGGGIRIKKLITYDGVDQANVITTSYDYNNLDGTSSGVAIDLPAYSFTNNVYATANGNTTQYDEIGNTGATLWKKLTIRSKYNLFLNDGPSVGYERVTVSSPNKGSTVNYFNVPINLASTDSNLWGASKLSIARENRPGTCEPLAPLQSFGGIIKPTHSLNVAGMGAISKQQMYHEDGTLLNESIYQYTSSPSSIVKAITMNKSITRTEDYNPSTQQNEFFDVPIYLYDNYLITNTSYLLASTQTNTFDVAGNLLSETVSYTYDQDLSSKLRERHTILSTGDEYRTTYKYLQDYTVQAAEANQDDATLGISKLIGHGVKRLPVEEVTFYKPNEGIEKAISGSLNLYKYHSNQVVFLWKTLALEAGGGISGFVPSTIDNTGGTDVFNHDQHYAIKSAVKDFDIINKTVTGVELDNRNLSGHHFDYEGNGPVCEISGALASEVAYTGFESLQQNKFEGGTNGFEIQNVITNLFATTHSEGRKGGASLRLAGGGLGYLIRKNLTKQSDTKYIFSLWAKSTGTKNLSVSCTDGTLTESVNLAINSSSYWQYYEVILSVNALADNITISITGDDDIEVDDLLFYPESANVVIKHYDNTHLLMAETLNERTTSYEYDHFDNLKLVRDADDNILQRQTVKYPRDYYSLRNPVINIASGVVVLNQATTFKVVEEQGAQYYWAVIPESGSLEDTEGYDFSGIAASSSTFVHTFLDNQAYAVYLKIRYNGEDSFAKLRNISAVPSNITNNQLNYCLNGATKVDICGQEASIINECQSDYSVSIAGSTTIAIDDGGYTGTVEYRWDIYTTSADDEFEINSLPAGDWNTSDTWSSTKQAKVISDYTQDTYLIGYMRVDGNDVGETAIVHIDAYHSQGGC